MAFLNIQITRCRLNVYIYKNVVFRQLYYAKSICIQLYLVKCIYFMKDMARGVVDFHLQVHK